jgi:hypothetical protein
VKPEGDARGLQYPDSRMADQLPGNCREINYIGILKSKDDSRVDFLHRHFKFFLLIFLQYKGKNMVLFFCEMFLNVLLYQGGRITNSPFFAIENWSR